MAPLIRDGLYDGTQTVTTTDNGNGTVTQTTSYNNTAFNAITAGIATLSGGLAAGLAGSNAQAGATSAENEALNNATSTKSTTVKAPDAIQPVFPLENLLLGGSGLYRLASTATEIYDNLFGSSADASPTTDNTSSTTPIGRRGNPIDVKPGTNQPATINGVDYSGHALDQMQGRGITPSVVEDTIATGDRAPGNTPGTTVYTSSQNRVSVVTNSNGRIITVITK